MQHAAAALTLGLVGLVALLAGCVRPAPPIDPAEAPAAASEALESILDRTPASAGPLPSPPPAAVDGPVTVSVWYPDHPLMRRLASPPVRAAFTEAHPDITLEAQGMGDWMYAVQKLTVHIAGGGLPDIAVVRRGLLAQLAPSGHILALDDLLPDELLNDFDTPVREAYAAGPQLTALPADAFHSVLYTVETPPESLEALAKYPGNGPATIGHLPFMETLWALGGDVLAQGRPAMDSDAARGAFALMHALYAPGTGHAARNAMLDETHGVALFISGRANMTVASSRSVARVLEQRPETRMHPVPGPSGGVSRWGEYAIVVFAGAEAKGEAIAAVLDFLTGPVLQGAEALEGGSPPVRRSVRASVDEDHPLLKTWGHARAAPLVPEWGELESALLGIVERATRF